MKRKRPPRRTLEVLFDDDQLVAVNKPAGISSVSERWDPDLPTVVDELHDRWKHDDPEAPRPHIVHRLDKGTSGVLLFARNTEAQAHLQRQFQERTVEKSYLALASGLIRSREGTIEINIEEHHNRAGEMIQVSHGGKPCFTSYEVIEYLGNSLTWVRLRPKTGRTHQIRVSLQSIGHPLAVDHVYGKRVGSGRSGKPADGIYLSTYKRSYRPTKGEKERPLIGRLTLHAESLIFTHPTTGAMVTLEAELPKDMRATLKQLRRWAGTSANDG